MINRRRILVDNYIPEKLPAMPLVCPEKRIPTSEDLLSPNNDTSYQNGINYNYWFVSPEELSATDENGIGTFNLGETEGLTENWIDVNIIEEFNKRRARDGIYCYSCIPGYVSGYEKYEHPLPSIDYNYTIYETLKNGREKVTTVKSIATARNVYTGSYPNGRYLWIGYVLNTSQKFKGRLYYLNFYDSKTDEPLIKLEATQNGLIDGVSGKKINIGTTKTDEEGNLYIEIDGQIDTGLTLPQWFRCESKFMFYTRTNETNFNESNNYNILWGIGKSDSYLLNNAGIMMREYSSPTFYNYRESVYSTSRSLTQPLEHKVSYLNYYIDPNNSDKDGSCIIKYGDITLDVSSKQLRVLSHIFEEGSTKRMVFVNKGKFTGTISAIRPNKHAVWLYTGLCGVTYYAHGKLGVPDTLRVVHRNPNIQLSTAIHVFQSTSITGGALIKNWSLRNSSLLYNNRIYGWYLYDDLVYLDSESSTHIGEGSSKAERWFIDSPIYIKPIKETNSNIILGPKATTYYFDEDYTNSIDEFGLRRGDVLYFKDDNNHILSSIKTTIPLGLPTDILDVNGNPVYKFTVKDSCTIIDKLVGSYCGNGYSSTYSIFDFNDVVEFRYGCFYNLHNRILGNKIETDGSYSLVLDTSQTFNTQALGFNFFGDRIYFTNSIGYTKENPYTGLAYTSCGDLRTAWNNGSYKNIDIIYPEYLLDSLYYHDWHRKYTNISMLGWGLNLVEGNRYINTSSYIQEREDGNYTELKMWYGPYALETNYYSVGELLEEKEIDGIVYKRFESVFFNDGTYKCLTYLARNSSIKKLSLGEGYNIGGGVQYHHFSNNRPNLKVLDLSKSIITNAHRFCEHWTSGGLIFLPKTLKVDAFANNSRIQDYIGGSNCGKIGAEENNDDKRLNVYLTWDSYTTIPEKTETVQLMNPIELEHTNMILYVPTGTTINEDDEEITIKQAYLEKGWSIYNSETGTGCFYDVREYNPEEIDSIGDEYLLRIGENG